MFSNSDNQHTKKGTDVVIKIYHNCWTFKKTKLTHLILASSDAQERRCDQ